MTNTLLEKVTPSGVKGKPTTQAPKRRWWMGTLPGCPKQKLILRGLCFSDRSGDFGGRGGHRGVLADLTEDQVKGVFDALGNKVVRNPGDGNAQILDVRKDSFQPLPSDQPLALYVYLLPEERAAEITGAHNWITADPPSIYAMLQRGEREQDWAAPAVARDKSEAERLREELAKANAEIAALRDQVAAEEGDTDEAPAEDAAARTKQLEQHNKAELAAYAAQHDIELPKEATKAQMIEAIIKAEQESGQLE